MKLSSIGRRRLLRVSSALVIVGLLLEIVSLMWFHPLSFVLFAFVAATLIGLGVLVYLVSLVFVVTPTAGSSNWPPRSTCNLEVRDLQHHRSPMRGTLGGRDVDP
jgi:hypothetical protein